MAVSTLGFFSSSLVVGAVSLAASFSWLSPFLSLSSLSLLLSSSFSSSLLDSFVLDDESLVVRSLMAARFLTPKPRPRRAPDACCCCCCCLPASPSANAGETLVSFFSPLSLSSGLDGCAPFSEPSSCLGFSGASVFFTEGFSCGAGGFAGSDSCGVLAVGASGETLAIVSPVVVAVVAVVVVAVVVVVVLGLSSFAGVAGFGDGAPVRALRAARFLAPLPRPPAGTTRLGLVGGGCVVGLVGCAVGLVVAAGGVVVGFVVVVVVVVVAGTGVLVAVVVVVGLGLGTAPVCRLAYKGGAERGRGGTVLVVGFFSNGDLVLVVEEEEEDGGSGGAKLGLSSIRGFLVGEKSMADATE